MARHVVPWVAFALTLGLTGCAQSGSMIVEGADSGGGARRTTYSKYFDAGEWLIPDKLGISVVVDNDTPVSQQVFGGLKGTDSFGVGTVTVYFWNLEKQPRTANSIRVSHKGRTLEHTADFKIGPGPFTRTQHVAGTVPFFAYAIDLKLGVAVEIDGQILQKEVTVLRRTSAEMKKYFGPGGEPPYPWFDTKYAVKQ